MEVQNAAPAGAPAATTAAPSAEVKALEVKAEETKTVETKVEEPKAPEVPAAKDPKAIHQEQERRLEQRATKLRADLAKREQDIVQKAAELAKREETLKELTSLKDAKSSAKDDPISFLEAFGLTFEDVAKAAANGTGSDPAARKALKEARELRAKLEEKEKAETEAQKKQAEARDAEKKQATLKNIDGMLKADKKYRFAAEFGSAEDVFDAWFQAYQTTGKMPDVHKIAEKVNEFYKGEAKRAYEAWLQENPPVKPEEKKVEATVEKKDDPVVPAEKKPETKAEKKDGEELRGRMRGQGAKSYQGEIMKQLEEARKSRAS